MGDRAIQPGSNGGGPRNGHVSPPVPPSPAPAPAPAAGFEELRELLVGPEQAALQQLQDPERRVAEIAEALPEAIARRGTEDRLLLASLRPLAQETMTQLVKQRPQFFADLFSPIIAPTIRRSIAQAFEKTLEAIRRLTEQTFTLQGLKWRVEAWRSGLSVAEVAMRHTLLYRVDQVFLIHRETGVLLQYVFIPDAPGADSDMVSGMLTAIGQFVRDSFKGVDESQSLNAIRMGEFIVWIEAGPHAYLAVTIRGTPPADLRELLQDTLDGIHTLQAQQFENFQGDVSAFDVCRPELEACLRSESSAPLTKHSNRGAKLFVLALALGLIAWLVTGAIQASHERERRRQLVSTLEAEPGLMTTFVDATSKPMRLRGLRDPLAADPERIIRDAGFKPGEVEARWEPYYSLVPAFVIRRAKQELAPPDGVTLQVDGTTLRAEGRAPNAWVVSLRRNARAIPGVVRLDESKLIDIDQARWRELAREMEAVMIRFEGTEDSLGQAQRDELARGARLAIEAAAASARFGRGTQIEVTGELFRASAVANALGATAGVPPAVTRAAPPRAGKEDTVSFRLLLTEANLTR